jgi:hypothetical protein
MGIGNFSRWVKLSQSHCIVKSVKIMSERKVIEHQE